MVRLGNLGAPAAGSWRHYPLQCRRHAAFSTYLRKAVKAPLEASVFGKELVRLDIGRVVSERADSGPVLHHHFRVKIRAK